MARNNPKRIRVTITNPPEGCRSTTSLDHARRYARKNRGVLDEESLTLTFFAAGSSIAGFIPDIRDAADFRPSDARPGMPLLPPSAEWIRRMGYNRVPLSEFPAMALAATA